MENSGDSSSDLTQEHAMIRQTERLRIAEMFRDAIAPEFVLAMFELYTIQKDLESRGLSGSAHIERVTDRISAAVTEFLAALAPSEPS